MYTRNMRLVVCLLFCAIISWKGNVDAYNISATGGGIVKIGEDLVLSMKVGKTWDRCHWFVYEHASDSAHNYHCSFDQDPATGNVSMHSCEPEDAKKFISYTGTDPKECTITASNVTEDFNCGWSARLDTDRLNSDINITVAKPVTAVNFTSEADLIAGEIGKLICLIPGGRPEPHVEINKVDDIIVNNTIDWEIDGQGLYTITQNITVKPQIEDHGSNVTCKAYQLDNLGKKLFNETIKELTLNVTFPPQKEENQTQSADKGGNVTIEFEFMANPMPTRINWVITIPAVVGSRKYSHLVKELNGDLANSSKTVNLSPGYDDGKYVVFETEEKDDGITFATTLQILDLKMIDQSDEYYLEVENARGVQKYFFEVLVKDNGGDDGPDKPEHTSPNNAAVVIVIVCIVALIVLALGFYILYRKNQIPNETSPLATMETRR